MDEQFPESTTANHDDLLSPSNHGWLVLVPLAGHVLPLGPLFTTRSAALAWLKTLPAKTKAPKRGGQQQPLSRPKQYDVCEVQLDPAAGTYSPIQGPDRRAE